MSVFWDHGTARDDHFAAVGHRSVGDLLQTMDMACEAGDDHAALRVLDDLAKRTAHFGLGRREVGILRVRGVGHHQVDAHLGETRQRAEIGMHAVDGALVELEVARVQDVARRRLHEHAHGARNGVVHREEIDDEAAQLDFVARLDLCELGLHAMLVELALDQAERHFGAVDRHLAGQVFHQVRQRSVCSSWPWVMMMPRSLCSFSST